MFRGPCGASPEVEITDLAHDRVLEAGGNQSCVFRRAAVKFDIDETERRDATCELVGLLACEPSGGHPQPHESEPSDPAVTFPRLGDGGDASRSQLLSPVVGLARKPHRSS